MTVAGSKDIALCRTITDPATGQRCNRPALPDYPHRHETPVSPSYDPMPPRPSTTRGMLAIARREYWSEVPEALHVGYVPSQTQPIQIEAKVGGVFYEIDVLDTGALGSPSWSPAFHRYVGAARWWEGEMVLADEDLAPFPWHRQLESIRRWCAGRHRTWYEHLERPLCWLLLRQLVIGGYALGRAAEREGVSEEKARELVDEAVRKWWAFTSNALNEIEVRRRLDRSA